MKAAKRDLKFLYPIGLAVLALLVFIYVFNPKIDFNGDNCYYYIFASSLVKGEGFSDIMGRPTALFPPGYPLLMAPLRALTDSVIAQKVLNFLFLFAGVLLLYFSLLRDGVKRFLAFVVCAGVLVTPHILEFTTMMMSEASCIFFILLSLCSFVNISNSPRNSVPWSSPWLYLLLLAVPFAFLVRTQAVVLLVAVGLALLLERRIKVLLLLVASFIVIYAPWAARNYFLELGQSRYVSQIDFSNIWGNVQMLLVQALPESCLPFFEVNYAASPSLLLYIVSAAMLVLVAVGFWQLKRLRIVMLVFFVANVGIVSIMDTPSFYRYMIIVLPVVTAGVVLGLWRACDFLCARFWRFSFPQWALLLLFVPTLLGGEDESKHTIHGLNKLAKIAYPPNIEHFFAIGKEASKLGDAQVVASRKPELLYVHSGVKGLRYKEHLTNIKILNALIDDNVDYLILENMGFEYAYKVLYPFLMQHKKYFKPVLYTKDPVNALFKFDREEARRQLILAGHRSN